MDPGRLIERIGERCGLSAEGEAEGALVAVLEALGPALPGPLRARLAKALPEGWRGAVDTAEPDPGRDREQVELAVAEHERVGVGFGREHVTAVCQVLAEQAGADLRRALAGLPRGLGALFDPHVATEGGPERLDAPHEHHPHRETLAGGRPGSHHPVSEGRPAGGQRHSVAASDDPHADTRLSSAQGTTQQRQGRTLAEGQPGSEEPISEDD